MEKNNWYEEFRHEPLPKRLRSCRKHFGWSQEELAFRSGISGKTISRMECGKLNLRLDTLSLLERAMSLPCGYLYVSEQSEISESRAEYLENFTKEIKDLSLNLTDEQFYDHLDDLLASMRRTAERNKIRSVNSENT